MQYLQTPKQAREISEKVLQRIQDEGLHPNPENYELWYVYYGQLDAELVRAVEILEENQQEITNDRCQELHQRFLSQTSENERVRQAGNEINKTIEAVGTIVHDVQEATSDYNTSLEDVSQKLSRDIDIEEAREALEDVAGATRNVLQQNLKLEEALSQSNSVMQSLQRDLEKVRKEALIDGLTGLANRKAFDTEIVRIHAEAKENETTFCFVMLDIDHFKDFNDTYGHQIGDQVLRLVGKTLFDGVKGRDVVARYGGEEFAIILPNTPLDGGLKLTDALRKSVASKEVINRNSGQKLGKITISGGIAEFTADENPEDIIARADAALYTAKRNGRNQISVAPETAPTKVAG